MKAFVAVALLVASVAAGPLSYERSLLNGYGKIGGLSGLPLSTVRDAGIERVTLPMLERLGGEQSGYSYNTILTIEELYNTEIFREYLTIPLFRQYLEVPAFQRYIVSPLFQRLFVYREFQQYFKNPVLFYKYIYPQIVAVSQQYRQVDQIDVNTIRPVVDSVYGDHVVRDNVDSIIRSVFGERVGRDNVDVLRRGIYNYPTVQSGVYRQQLINNQVEIKYLLERIVRDLVENRNIVPTTEVITDINVLPRERISVQERIVDPITGAIRVVDEVVPRVQQQQQVRDILTPVQRQQVRDILTPVERQQVIDILTPVERQQVRDILTPVQRDVVDRDIVTPVQQRTVVDRLVRDALLNTVEQQRYGQQVPETLLNRPVITLENLINREIQY